MVARHTGDRIGAALLQVWAKALADDRGELSKRVLGQNRDGVSNRTLIFKGIVQCIGRGFDMAEQELSEYWTGVPDS